MADFCEQCTRYLFPPHMKNDFIGVLSSSAEAYKIELPVVRVLCEGCGPTDVDDAGKCVMHSDEKHRSLWQ